MVKHYKDADTWLDNNIVNEKSFDNLQDLLIKNNLIDKRVRFKDLVVNYE